MRILEWVFCICYPVQFQKDKSKDILALLNSESEINAIIPASATQLGLKVQKINVGAQKIDGSLPKTYKIGIATF